MFSPRTMTVWNSLQGTIADAQEGAFNTFYPVICQVSQMLEWNCAGGIISLVPPRKPDQRRM